MDEVSSKVRIKVISSISFIVSDGAGRRTMLCAINDGIC
jgi:hypothetical protein